MKMWIIKEFKTREAMDKFITRHSGKIQWQEVFMNNKYAIEYRKLRTI
jgi:hypothetical protein